MKNLPTVVASTKADLAIEVLEFQGSQRIRDRDAVGYYYHVRRSPGESPTRLAVVFSGTVSVVCPSAYDLPESDDKVESFAVFAEAAIGDFLDQYGLPDPTPRGGSATSIECFSPHFQAWRDRRPASDAGIEGLIAASLYWSWRFGHEGWELGPADWLRLHQPLKAIQRLVALGDGNEWNSTQRKPDSLWLVPTAQFLREKYKASMPSNHESAPGGQPAEATPQQQPATAPEYVFVDEARIADLRRTPTASYDLRKLIAICEELNQCYRSQCYHAVAALTRALIDHVPPIFGVGTFAGVANNYAGTKSFKDCMAHLEQTARKIADMHLHTQIRQKEALPNRTQVGFSQEIDVLLAEILRILGP